MRTSNGLRRVSVLGATGSIGRQTLDLLRRNPDHFAVEALAAGSDADGLAEAALAVGARFAALADPAGLARLRERLAGSGIACAAGPEAVIEAAARPADWVMAAIVGAAGLKPVMAALARGATVALANKECLVAAGSVMMAAAASHGATLLPVDSEHNAIFQVLDRDRPEGVEKLILTASGGPFRTWPAAKLAAATPEQAVAHPNWSMGAKISVDSASLMNKGLELIEAARLFDMAEDRIDVLVHPQSVIHSLVAYVDGSVLAQLGAPDMRIPIAYCLAWPERMATPAPRLDLAALAQLTFEAPDDARFPALSLARQALRAGGAATAILSAANEVAVAAFLARRIGFLDIPATVAATLDALGAPDLPDLEAVLEWDAAARRRAERVIVQRSAA